MSHSLWTPRGLHASKGFHRAAGQALPPSMFGGEHRTSAWARSCKPTTVGARQAPRGLPPLIASKRAIGIWRSSRCLSLSLSASAGLPFAGRFFEESGLISKAYQFQDGCLCLRLHVHVCMYEQLLTSWISSLNRCSRFHLMSL